MIKGEQISIRAPKSDDSSKYSEWINDRDLVHLSSSFRPISDASHAEWFQNILNREDMVVFSIVKNDASELIGSCSLRNIDHVHKNAELQIRIGVSSLHGKGYGTEATRLLLEHAFNDLNLERVYLNVFADNQRAVKSYQKNGFSEEGELRKAVFINGAFKNIKIMSILKEEYKNDPLKKLGHRTEIR